MYDNEEDCFVFFFLLLVLLLAFTPPPLLLLPAVPPRLRRGNWSGILENCRRKKKHNNDKFSYCILLFRIVYNDKEDVDNKGKRQATPEKQFCFFSISPPSYLERSFYLTLDIYPTGTLST